MPQSLPATRSTAAAGVAEAEAADYVRSDYLMSFARSAGSFGRGELLNTNKRMSTIAAAAFADTKPHYDILDGLRGIAALTVVWFHIFEAFATSHLDQRINHGYLAVDFFFILSGFVIGYAYDDRWKKKMSVKVLKTNDTWYGMTYHEDVASVKDSFRKMQENGVYKADLFSDL